MNQPARLLFDNNVGMRENQEGFKEIFEIISQNH
jgi:hypothetical protein